MASRESRFSLLMSEPARSPVMKSKGWDVVPVVIVVVSRLGGLDSFDSDEDSTLEANFSSLRATLTDEESFSLSAGVSSKCLWEEK